MQDYPVSFWAMIISLWDNKYLLKKSIQRDVVGRYKGSILGLFWSLFQPLFMLMVYTFIFSVVFKARWPGGSESKTEFALILFSGLMIFNLFAECMNSAPSLILNHSNYVKKVIFPLEIFPWITLGCAGFNLLVSFFVWLMAFFLLMGPPPLTILLLPFILAPLCFFTVGLSYFLSALGVYLRDIAQLTIIATTAMLFLTPIFYSIENLDSSYHIFLYLNPLTTVVEQARAVLLWGTLPGVFSILVQYTLSLFLCWLGFAWFQKTRKGFADVL